MARPLLIAFALLSFASARAAETPPPEHPELALLVGEYGEGPDAVTVLEAGGELHARKGRDDQRVIGPLTISVDAKGDVGLSFNGRTLQRTDIARDRVAFIRARVKRDLAALRAVADAGRPPQEPAPKAASDLVELASLDPTLRFDIRYATTNNFMGLPLYERAEAFLQRPAAEALVRANKRLARLGFGIVVFDGYRPWRVTKLFWDATPDDAHVFVADPSKGSRHNRGCAADIGLYDLATGRELVMISRYDEMSPRAYADYPGGTERQRWLRAKLREAMEAEGFTVYPEEWWHFDYNGWKDFGIGEPSFTTLLAGRPSAPLPPALPPLSGDGP